MFGDSHCVTWPVLAENCRIAGCPAVPICSASPFLATKQKVTNMSGFFNGYSTSFSRVIRCPASSPPLSNMRPALFTMPITTPGATPWPETSATYATQ